jgi:hypothetical protein
VRFQLIGDHAAIFFDVPLLAAPDFPLTGLELGESLSLTGSGFRGVSESSRGSGSQGSLGRSSHSFLGTKSFLKVQTSV